MNRRRLNAAFAAISLGGIALLSSGHIAFAAPDSPTDQYLALRRTYPPISVSPSQLSTSPANYAGKTVEVEGLLSGVVRNDRGALLMLATSQFGPLNLSMSEIPTWVQSGSRLRILAVVSTGTGEDDGMTIGIPDLVVVAVASASDIATEEERWREEAARRADRDRQQQAALVAASSAMQHGSASATHRRTSVTLASRGGGSGGYTLGSATPSGGFAQYLSPAARSIYPAYVGFVQHWNRRLTLKEADAIASSILIYSEHYGVDPRLVVSLIIAESDFHVGETSNKGAMGLGQLMPDEVHDMGLTNPYDPTQNIAGAVYLLRGRLDHYATGPGLSMQQIILALASYNAGMGAVKKYGGVPPYRETQNYVKKIERIYMQLCAADPGR